MTIQEIKETIQAELEQTRIRLEEYDDTDDIELHYMTLGRQSAYEYLLILLDDDAKD